MLIYLDYAATAPTHPRAIEAMTAAMRESWANPGASYAAAGAARRVLNGARRTVAAMLGAEPQEVLFTSGGTEGNNHALTLAAGGHAVVGALEHASVLRAAERHARSTALVLPDEHGRILPQAVARALRPDTRLISVQYANNETGVINPVAEIGALARERGIPLHCDAVQGFGRVPLDVRALKVDLLTLSAHKLGGPRGVGALYVRQGVPLAPLLAGGGQEFGLRSGTENVAGAAGLGAVCALAAEAMADEGPREAALMEGFIARVRRKIPGARVLGAGAPRLPGIAALYLPGLTSERAVAELDLLGVAASGGAACASQSREPSHVYRAMGLSDRDARCVLRVSIGSGTTADQMERAAEALKKIYKKCAEI